MTTILNLTEGPIVVRPYPTNGLDVVYLGGSNSVHQVELPPGVWELTRPSFVSVVDCSAAGWDHQVVVMSWSEYTVASMRAGAAFERAMWWIVPILLLVVGFRWLSTTVTGAIND